MVHKNKCTNCGLEKTQLTAYSNLDEFLCEECVFLLHPPKMMIITNEFGVKFNSLTGIIDNRKLDAYTQCGWHLKRQQNFDSPEDVEYTGKYGGKRKIPSLAKYDFIYTGEVKCVLAEKSYTWWPTNMKTCYNYLCVHCTAFDSRIANI